MFRFSSRLPRCLVYAVLGLAIGAPLLPAQAGVIISGTRQVYPEQRREITVRVTNDDKHAPRLVQAWLDAGDASVTAEQSDVPFSLTPPVFRVDPGKSQAMRLAYTREPLPKDKESVFWLNVLEVPPLVSPPPGAAQDEEDNLNHLRFAFRIRTKVFFRPQSLPGKPEEAPAQLRWSVQGSTLKVHNPSAYHVSFNEVAVALGTHEGAKVIQTAQQGMVAPFTSLEFALTSALGAPPAQARVQFKYIDDFGGFSAMQQAPLNP